VPMSFPIVLMASVVNPVFEELLEAGYIINTLRRFGPWIAVGASAALRGLAHMYQGLNGVLVMFVYGLVMASAYWRYRQLLPLLLAHGIDDFIGFIIA